MTDETNRRPRFDRDDVGSTLYDVEGGEIGTIEDYDDDHLYVEPSEDFDDEEKIESFGWRAPDGSYEINTDAIEGIPDGAAGEYGVDLSGYERPDE